MTTSTLPSRTFLEDLLGFSPAMRLARESLLRAAPGDAPVLITGEAGTGHEAAARALHHHSARRDGPFVVLRAGTLPLELMCDELFDLEGALLDPGVTGAVSLLDAHQGTLLLEDVAELTVRLQRKLLAVLQARHAPGPAGDIVPFDVRVVATSPLDLEALVSAGRFDEEFFFFLTGGRVRLPALRERPEDVPTLVEHLVRAAATAFGKRVTGVSPEALRRLREHRWEGNVAQLRTTLEDAVAAAPGHELGLRDLPAALQPSRAAAREDAALERRAITEALASAGGSITVAARTLGLGRHVLRFRMQELGMGEASAASAASRTQAAWRSVLRA